MSDLRRNISSRIEYIYRTYYATAVDEEIYSKIEKRFLYLVQLADTFCASLPISSNIQYHVSRVRMEAVVKSHFLDVIRFKEYHFNTEETPYDAINTTDNEWAKKIHHEKSLSDNKVAAFIVKWIVKHSPISFSFVDELTIDEDSRYIINVANIRFAIIAALEIMKLEPSKIDQIQLHRFIYHLAYRPIDDRALFGWLEVFKKDKDVETTKRETSVGRKIENKSYKMFVASPNDVDFLRDIVKKVVDSINDYYGGSIRKINAVRWEDIIKPGKYKNPADIQENGIFKPTEHQWGGEDCDILLVFCWRKKGYWTTFEYEKWSNEMTAEDKHLLFFRYAKQPEALDAKGHKELGEAMQWEDDVINSGVVPLGGRKEQIDSPESFSDILGTTLRRIIDGDPRG